MENLEFYKSFVFKLYSFAERKHTDNSRGTSRHYFGYLRKGWGKIVSDEGTLELSEGDLFYIPKGCRYHSHWCGNDQIQFDSFAFEAVPAENPVDYTLQKLPLTPAVAELYRKLAENPVVTAHSVGLLYCLFSELAPHMKEKPYRKAEVLARKIASYIYEHPEESAKEIAKNCSVSESTLYHLLRQKLKKTPNTLRQEAKCHRAVWLLTTTDLSVEEISLRLGFSSSSYMRKLLRATTGKTPLQIRATAQNL